MIFDVNMINEIPVNLSTASSTTPMPSGRRRRFTIPPPSDYPVYDLSIAPFPVYFGQWSETARVVTKPAAQPAATLRFDRINQTHTLLTWDAFRPYAFGSINHTFVYMNRQSNEVGVAWVVDPPTRSLLINDTLWRLRGADNVALILLNLVGASPQSNLVPIQPLTLRESTQVQSSSDSSGHVRIILGTVIPLTLLLALLVFLLLRRRQKREAIISFPEHDEWEVDPEKVFLDELIFLFLVLFVVFTFQTFVFFFSFSFRLSFQSYL